MRQPVGDVVELVGPDRAVRLGLCDLFGQAAGEADIIVRIGIGHGRHFDELRAAQPQHVLLFLALRLRDDNDGSEAECVGDECDPDSGITRRALDDDATGLQRATCDGIADDEQRRAILHRLAGIHELGLAENVAPGLLRCMLELDEWRVADGLDDVLTDLHDTATG